MAEKKPHTFFLMQARAHEHSYENREKKNNKFVSTGANPLVVDGNGRTPRRLSTEIRNQQMGENTQEESFNESASAGDMDGTIALLLDAEWRSQICSSFSKKRNENIINKLLPENLQSLVTSGSISELKTALENLPEAVESQWKLTRADFLGNLLSSKMKTPLPFTLLSLMLFMVLATCRINNPEIVELLLRNGASIEFRDSDGSTPLLVAADIGAEE